MEQHEHNLGVEKKTFQSIKIAHFKAEESNFEPTKALFLLLQNSYLGNDYFEAAKLPFSEQKKAFERKYTRTQKAGGKE